MPPNPLGKLFGVEPSAPSATAPLAPNVGATVKLPPNPLAVKLTGNFAPAAPPVAPKVPTLPVPQALTSKLPPNPLSAKLTGVAPAAPKLAAPAPAPVDPQLHAFAVQIATSAHLAPAFVAHLQELNAADPSFNSRLNAEVARVTNEIEAQRNSTPLAIAGQVIEQTVNPAEWIKSGVQGIGELRHGHLASGALDTAALFPFLKAPGAIAEGVRAVDTAEEAASAASKAERVARTEAEAQAAVEDAAKTARAQGHGAIGPKIPKLKPGEVTPETGGELGAQIRSGLKAAPALRKEQTALQSIERGKRAGAIDQALQSGDVAGHNAALAAAKGELPHVAFEHLTSLGEDGQKQLNAAISHITNHPGYQPFEKLRAVGAIRAAVEDGKLPTKGEAKLLARSFGKEGTDNLVSTLTTGQKFKSGVREVLNVPRALMASFDLSAPFRQGLVAGVSHPRIFFKNFAPMVKSAGSEDFYQGVMSDIRDRPTFPLMAKARLALTDIGTDPHVGVSNLSDREEQFMSNLAERIPGIGRVVRGSDRAYTGFLNKTRADIFDSLVHDAAAQGHDVNDEKVIRSIADFVNSATGRGDLPAFANHAATMNTLFFSPRLLYSRLNFLNPLYYARLDPFARKQALVAGAKLLGTMSTVLYLAKLAGAQVGTDPRNADFAKIRLGDTRIDILGGFQQPVRLAVQLATGEVVSSTSGNLEHLSGGFAGRSRLDVLGQFALGKAAPVPSTAIDLLKGQTFAGGKPTLKGELYGHLTPLSAQDAVSLEQQSGPVAALAGYLADIFGVGLQTYSAKTPPGGSSSGVGGYGDNTSGGYGSSGSSGGYDSGGFGESSSGGYGSSGGFGG